MKIIGLTQLLVWWDVFGGKKIRASQLSQLQTESFLISLAFSILVLVIALFICESIQKETGTNPRDPFKRKLVFYTLGFLGTLAYFAINTWKIASNLSPGLANRFSTVSIICICICVGAYFLGGFAAAKIFRNANISTLFPSRKEKSRV